MAKTIDDFIKQLKAISPSKRKLPLVIVCPNGEEAEPNIKMGLDWTNGFPPLGSEPIKMVITWQN